MQTSQIELLMQKLQSLRPERIAEVEDFIDFLRSRDEERFWTRAALKATDHDRQELRQALQTLIG